MTEYGLSEEKEEQEDVTIDDYWAEVEKLDLSRQWIPVQNLLTENEIGETVLCDPAVVFFDSVRREYQARPRWKESPEQAACKGQQMQQFLMCMRNDWPEYYACVQRKCTHDHGLTKLPGRKPLKCKVK